jgi:hypothetical protein
MQQNKVDKTLYSNGDTAYHAYGRKRAEHPAPGFRLWDMLGAEAGCETDWNRDSVGSELLFWA